MVHHASKSSALLHTIDLWIGSKGRDIFFAEDGHVAYQFNRKEVYNIMQVKRIEIVQISIF